MSRRAAAPGRARDLAVVWHDVECADYAADLQLWRELAAERGDPILDLGCGTGRVALDLAARGHEVIGLDSDPALVGALAARARGRGLWVDAEAGDARSFALGREFGLVLAPMQVVQLLGGAGGRQAMLASVRRHLRPGGLFAPALADPFSGLPAADALPPLPDVREEDGWVYASTPVAVREEVGASEGPAGEARQPDGEAPALALAGARDAEPPAPARRTAAIDRLRQSVSPAGELSESLATIRLDLFPPEELERAAEAAGFRVLPRRSVPETDAYVGSAVLMLEATP